MRVRPLRPAERPLAAKELTKRPLPKVETLLGSPTRPYGVLGGRPNKLDAVPIRPLPAQIP